MRILFIIAILLIPFTNPLLAQETVAKGQTDEVKIDWIKVEELEGKLKEEPRKVLIDLYTNWCGWCKRMDKTTFGHPEIVKYVNENYYAVKFNAETKDTVNFMGYPFEFIPQGRKGFNKLAYMFVNGDNPKGRMSYPTIAFLNEEGQRMTAVPGYKDPYNMDVILHYIEKEDFSTSFKDFMEAYQSPIPVPEPKEKQMGKPKPSANKVLKKQPTQKP